MAKRRAKKRSLLQSAAVGWILRAALLITLLWLLCWAIWGDSIAYLGYVNAAALLWALVSLFAAAIFFWRKERGWGIFAFLLALSLMLPGTGFNIGSIGTQDTARTPDSIRLISASLRGRNDGADSSIRASLLLDLRPDVIAAQGVAQAKELHAAINAEADRDWNMLMDGGLVLLSPHQIERVPIARIKSLLTARVTIEGKKIDIWTLRAPKDFAKPIENVGFHTALERAIIAAKPDIVMGDFNATWWNEGYRRTGRHMNNAHVDAGFGFGNSFPASVRKLGLFGGYARIDHIFLRRGLTASHAFTGKAAAGADHNPVVADIQTGFEN